MDWVKANYDFVDITEYEMKLERRRSIENLCIQFFKDWELGERNTPITSTCSNHVNDTTFNNIVRDLVHQLTLSNFNSMFHSMCDELFGNDKQLKDGYIISLLCFCVKLNETLRDYIWYTITLMISTLVEALEKHAFNPLSFQEKHQDDGGLTTLFLEGCTLIIPPLILFYILSKQQLSITSYFIKNLVKDV